MSESILPAGAILLGINSAPFAIKGGGSLVVVRPQADEQRQLKLLRAAGRPAGGRVYLLLEHLRGTQDATMLDVYVNLPAGTSPNRRADWRVGTWGLFGLRLASLPDGAAPGEGLTTLFDATPQVLGPPAGPAAAAELTVSLLPSQPLPDPADFVLEGVSFYYSPMG